MAFAVPCKSCGARFLLNDDLLRRKIAGSVVTVRCRHCEAKIQIDASDMDPTTLPSNDKPEAPLSEAELAFDATEHAAPTERRPQAVVALSRGLLPTRSAPDDDAEPISEVPESEPEVFDPGDWDVEAVARSAPSSSLGLDEITSGAAPDTAATGELEAEGSARFRGVSPSDAPTEPPPPSSGVPSLHSLAHLEPERRHTLDPLLLNLGADPALETPLGAPPSIDVSSLRAEAPTLGPTIDVSHLGEQKRERAGAAAASLYDVTFEPEAPPLAARRVSTLSPASLDTDNDEALEEERHFAAAPLAQAAEKKRGLGLPFALGAAAALAFVLWWNGGNSKSQVAAATPPVSEPVAALAEAAPASVTEPAPEPAAPASAAAAPSPALEAPSKAAPGKLVSNSLAKKSAPASSANEPERAPTSVEPAAPADEPKAQPVGASFDRELAASALGSAAGAASACRQDGDPSGVASVTVTFAPSGKVTSANLSGPPFAGTKTGSCIASALRKAAVPAFAGERVTVSKTIVVQ